MLKFICRCLLFLFNRKVFWRSIPAELYLKVKYYYILERKLNLKDPKDFNEKLQWLKIYNKNHKLTTLVDKYAVRTYVKDTIGEDYSIPLVGGPWQSVDQIDLDQLPESFVLKCTHDSGSTIVCKDKKDFDFQAAKKKLATCLKENYYWPSREWPYKNVPPQIIVEKYTVDESGCDLKDYKFMVFNGEVKCLFVCSERATGSLKVTFYDTDWNLMPFIRKYPNSSKPIPRPKQLEEMIGLAKKLAGDLPFARIDFYLANEKICFSEITLFPGGGFEAFTPESWDRTLGSWLRLPEKYSKEVF